MAMQPLQDNAGAGISLLDSILHARVSQTGVVLPTLTRLLYVAKLSKTAVVSEICDFHAQFLAEVDSDVTGLLVIQSGSLLNIIESSPEAVTALLRHLREEASRGDEARIQSVRVIGFTEDVPERQFSPWAYTSVSVPPEGTVNIEGEPALLLCATLYRTMVQVGQQLKEGGQTALDQLQERFAGYLPPDERVQALAVSDKITSLDEWLDIFDSPMTLSLSAEQCYPLPARPVY